MRRLKLTLEYVNLEGEAIMRSVTLPIPADKQEQMFDFEAELTSNGEELSMAIITSNVEVITWKDGDEVPTGLISEMNATCDNDLLVLTSPRLPDDPTTVMVFCPPSMEEFVMSGDFLKMYRDIEHLYESFYWSDHDKDLIVYFKDGKTMRYNLEDKD